jgi:DMSO/TMAO reductase YedYZ molybdopterin-dependent catalytic subunit
MISRRKFIAAGTSGLLVAGCDRLDRSETFRGILRSSEGLTMKAQRLITPRDALAPEYRAADMSPIFRSNGTRLPNTNEYARHLTENFADWRIIVDGLVARPLSIPIQKLRALPHRTQITRHDCVEGWSAIGKWKGVQLAHLLAQVRPLPTAKFVVFRCADSMDDPNAAADSKYYESVDMDDATHVQTVLAYELNGQPLPVNNGAPLRARIERQLGYKHAKYLMRIELVERLDSIRGGQGGYWEDNGYEWYAGI